MKVTKFGHCCLLIEENGLRILTDPGSYSTAQNEVKDVDVVLITHEHADHLHVESLKTVLANNPNARIFTNHGVAKILETEGIAYELLEHGGSTTVGGVLIEGFGEHHALMHPDIPASGNTGYFVANRLFYPGDAFTDPGKAVAVLALPVAGPWCKLSESIDYARTVKPAKCFPVHDGGLKSPGVAHRLPGTLLPQSGIEFIVISDGGTVEL